MAHEYLVEADGAADGMPTMRGPSLLVYFRPESGGCVMGGYSASPRRGRSTGSADFNSKLSGRTGRGSSP